MFPEVKEIFKDYSVFIGGTTSFDITPKQYNKLDAVLRYAAEHGYSLHQILFVGDDFCGWWQRQPDPSRRNGLYPD